MNKIRYVFFVIAATFAGFAAAYGTAILCIYAYLSELQYVIDSIIVWAVLGLSLCCFAGVFVSGLILKITRRREYRLLKDIQDLINGVAAGNYSVKIHPVKRDAKLNDCVEKVNSLIDGLRKTSEEKYDFINCFTHEFRTPITSIKGFSELMSENALTGEERRRYCDIICSECTRLYGLADTTRILNGLEEVAKIEETEFSVAEQIRECAAELKKCADEKSIRVEINLSGFKIRANYALSKQLWLNLISNAIKYGVDGGKVVIFDCEKNGFYAVSVADDGVGISKPSIEKIFRPYYRETSAKSAVGTGLGLTMVKRVADLHGWKISVDSEKGKGSIFTVITEARYEKEN